MSLGYHHPSDVFCALAELTQKGVDAALAIVTSVTGGAMRAPGAVMVISQTQECYGYISNGCVDGDIAAQAQRAISSGDNIALRYGEGSAFADIVLPCGGAIDVLVLPQIDGALITAICESLSQRRSIAIGASLAEGLTRESSLFHITYQPKLRLNIVGSGESVPALQGQAASAGFEARVVDHAQGRYEVDGIEADMWTAWVILFHDHDKEPPILTRALNSDAFYIGAMGSRKTHAARCEALRAQGVDKTQIARIHGPIGLIPSMRDANLLALSILAQIVEQAQKLARI